MVIYSTDNNLKGEYDLKYSVSLAPAGTAIASYPIHLIIKDVCFNTVIQGPAIGYL
jgi:hypothetical protein